MPAATQFDKMSNQIDLIAFLVLLHFGQTSPCTPANYSCKDIKTVEGFQYENNCPDGSEILIISNGTNLFSKLRDQPVPDCSNEVVNFDNKTTTFKNCRDIKIQCAFTSENGHEEESCVNISVFKDTSEATIETPTHGTTNETIKRTKEGTTGTGGIIGSIVGVAVSIAIVGIGVFLWRKGRLRCPRGRGGKDAKPVIALQSLDSGLSNGRSVPTETDNRNSSHQSVNGRAINGWTAGGYEAENHENERRALLLSPGTDQTQTVSNQTSDMTREAVASMSKPDFDHDRSSKCSAELEFDVESTSNSIEDLNNIRIDQ
ncbi:unnamed protein product [Ophioblennius macclurei]